MLNKSGIKKLCALALAAAMSLTLLGCGGEMEETTLPNGESSQTEPVMEPGSRRSTITASSGCSTLTEAVGIPISIIPCSSII